MSVRVIATGVVTMALGILAPSMLIYFWPDIEAWLNTPDGRELLLRIPVLTIIAAGVFLAASPILFTGKTRTIRHADRHLPTPGRICETMEVEKTATRSRRASRTELVVNHRGIRFRRITAQERNHR